MLRQSRGLYLLLHLLVHSGLDRGMPQPCVDALHILHGECPSTSGLRSVRSATSCLRSVRPNSICVFALVGRPAGRLRGGKSSPRVSPGPIARGGPIRARWGGRAVPSCGSRSCSVVAHGSRTCVVA